MKNTIYFALLGLFLSVSGCTDLEEEPGTGDGPGVDDEGPADPEDDSDPSCSTYPVPVSDAPGAEAAARDELLDWAPSAVLDWDASLGTLSSLLYVDVPLPDCSGGADVWDSLWPLIEEHPALFRMERSEWSPPESAVCADLSATTTVRAYRATFGAHTMYRGNMSFRLSRDLSSGEVSIESVQGTFIPSADAAMDAALAACPDLDVAAATLDLVEEAMPYTAYEWCAPQSEEVYMPTDLDWLEFSPEALDFWSWELDHSSGSPELIMRKSRVGALYIHESNWTPQLENNLYCWDENGDVVLGFEVSWDSVTRQVNWSNQALSCDIC